MPAAHRLEPLGREGAINPAQRDHVANRTQRRQVEPLHQIRFRRVVKPAAPAPFPVQRDEKHEAHARSREMSAAGCVIGPVRIDQGCRWRQIPVHQVVINHNHLETDLSRMLERGVGGRATIERDHQLGALPVQDIESRRAGPVTFRDAIGDIEHGLMTDRTQPAAKLGRGGRAIDIIIGKHGE